jgi:hypothetical protein
LSNVYANTCHYGGFSGSTLVVIIGCWFYLVDSSFTRVFCDVSIKSKLLFSTFKLLDTNPQLNFQLLLLSIALYDYKMSFNWVRNLNIGWNHDQSCGSTIFGWWNMTPIDGLNTSTCPRILSWIFVSRWDL